MNKTLESQTSDDDMEDIGSENINVKGIKQTNVTDQKRIPLYKQDENSQLL